MSDEEIRTLVENAEEWSPDNDAADNNGGAAAVTPNNTLPPLQLGSDVEIANRVAQFLRQQHGEVIFAEGRFWYYAGSHWRQFDDHELRLAGHRYDGATVPRSTTPVRLGSARVDSALNEMKAVLARPKFFAEAPPGINCASGFIAFAPDGTPTVQPHSPEHRCRHVLKGRFLVAANTLDPEKIFEFMPGLRRSAGSATRRSFSWRSRRRREASAAGRDCRRGSTRLRHEIARAQGCDPRGQDGRKWQEPSARPVPRFASARRNCLDHGGEDGRRALCRRARRKTPQRLGRAVGRRRDRRGRLQGCYHRRARDWPRRVPFGDHLPFSCVERIRDKHPPQFQRGHGSGRATAPARHPL